MYSICQNDQKIKNLSQKPFHNVYKMSPQAKPHEIEQFLQEQIRCTSGTEVERLVQQNDSFYKEINNLVFRILWWISKKARMI